MAEELSVFLAPVTTYSDEELAISAGKASSALTELLSENTYAQEFSIDLNNGRNQLHSAGVKELGNPETENKEKADDVRDRRYLYFRSKTESLIYSEDAVTASDAEKVLEKIKQRGYSMHYLGYKKQTSAMDGLILDLDDPEFREIMTRIGIDKEFTSMAEAEQAYKKVDNDSSRAAAALSNESLVDARKYVRMCIDECNAWLVNRFRKEPETMKQMVLRWNEIFSSVTAEARARSTRENNEAIAKTESVVS